MRGRRSWCATTPARGRGREPQSRPVGRGPGPHLELDLDRGLHRPDLQPLAELRIEEVAEQRRPGGAEIEFRILGHGRAGGDAQLVLAGDRLDDRRRVGDSERAQGVGAVIAVVQDHAVVASDHRQEIGAEADDQADHPGDRAEAAQIGDLVAAEQAAARARGSRSTARRKDSGPTRCAGSAPAAGRARAEGRSGTGSPDPGSGPRPRARASEKRLATWVWETISLSSSTIADLGREAYRTSRDNKDRPAARSTSGCSAGSSGRHSASSAIPASALLELVIMIVRGAPFVGEQALDPCRGRRRPCASRNRDSRRDAAARAARAIPSSARQWPPRTLPLKPYARPFPRFRRCRSDDACISSQTDENCVEFPAR